MGATKAAVVSSRMGESRFAVMAQAIHFFIFSRSKNVFFPEVLPFSGRSTSLQQSAVSGQQVRVSKAES